jgi:preprotein translocase subunit SecA
MQRIGAVFEKRKKKYGEADWEQVQQFLLLDVIDQKWKDHLHAIEVLKAGIGLRGYAQVDPKNEFKKESYEAFEQLKTTIADQLTDLIFKVELRPAAAAQPPTPARRRPPPPPDPVTALAMAQAMIDAGQAPPEVLDAMRRGGKLKVSPRGEIVIEGPPPGNGAAGTKP